MERSPRSAGVRPHTRASMGQYQYHTLRSFVISLVIAIAITKSPASGFTIRRSEDVLESTPDLETGESTQLEVRYDLKESSDIKPVVAIPTRSDATVIAINNTKNVNVKTDKDENINAAPATVNKTPDDKSKTSEAPFETSKLISIETSSNSYTTAAPSTSQTTITKGPEISQTFSITHSSIATESQNVTLNEFSNITNEEILKPSEIKENELAQVSHNSKEEINSTAKMYTAKINLNDSEVTNKSDGLPSDKTSDSYASRKEIARSVTESNIIIKNDTANDSSLDGSAGRNDDKGGLIKMLEFFEPLMATTVETEIDTIKDMFEAPLAEVDVTTESFNTETVTADFYVSTLPSWKKYRTINRKRTSTEVTTTLDKDMTKAETAQTRISLEKALSYTPIPSLEKLRNDLIHAQELMTNMTEVNVSSGQDLEINTSAQITTPVAETEPTKLEIVSKRAGFKDNTEVTTPKPNELETTTSKPKEATTSEFPLKASLNDTEIFNSMYETEAGDVDTPEIKNVTGVESQSQLAEDAIKEELLREETLNDNEENAQRHREEHLTAPKVRPLREWNNTDDSAADREIVTEDMLSVKPIGHDKKINTSLYAVSSNYKPLKKIDVQPSKQFVRDPDDNSWRNESISSLGIVFKPKNASKSFTEVLKNKTETELSNIEIGKDNKNDVPDLRIRLEKISEVRKSKKKKINKFGDIVYSDYEESSENVHPSKDEVTSPMSPSVETVLSSTLSSPPPSSTTELDLTVNAISREHIDIYKNDRTTPLTTVTPKKFYNLAEYYDTTDEYDADYVNLSKIDLMKFTPPFKTKETSATEVPAQPLTKAMIEYLPERKATVQYFPPTQKVNQKVNLNDYDTDFNKKVNLFTFKDSPKNVLSVSYGTVSPIPTEKYEQLNKITAKPAFTPIYKTDNLDKNLYLTNQPGATSEPSGFVVNDGNFNRASYVIKHYRDFINEAAKEGDDERGADFLPYTESPLRGVTINELAKMTTIRDLNPVEEEYDYDVKFRKDVMNRFVDNFNQNSERFKVDFPILYNSSVVHRNTPEPGKVASSSAFMKRMYEVGNPRAANFLSHTRPCDPHCDNMTVELSPAYELHYYVPDQEEKEEVEPRPATVPRRYRL